MQPLWQAVWRMCLHQLICFTFPLPSRKGARGMVQAPFEATPHTGSAEERCPPARGLGCPSARASGESRGVQPLWQAVWRMCLHQLICFTFPLPSRKGARGMVQAPLEATPHTGSAEGRGPSTTHAARLHHTIHKQRPPEKSRRVTSMRLRKSRRAIRLRRGAFPPAQPEADRRPGRRRPPPRAGAAQ